jgi:macrolide-specific efflux system membrane fusion protein
LIVQAQVDETDIGKIKEGQKAVITLDAYPDIEVQAKVEHVYYESKVVNNVTIYNVDILPEKVPDVFRSGMSANVRIIQQSKENILLIPSEAVKRGKDQEASFVWVSQGKGKKAEKREVKLGISDDTNIEVISGISENDSLVIRTKKPGASQKGAQAKTNPFMPGGGRR